MNSLFQSEYLWLLYGHCDRRCNSSLDCLWLFRCHQVNEFDLCQILPWGALLGGGDSPEMTCGTGEAGRSTGSLGGSAGCQPCSFAFLGTRIWPPLQINFSVGRTFGLPCMEHSTHGPPGDAPRGYRRSDSLQPLLLHPSDRREGSNITAPVHLLSQCLCRISWIFRLWKQLSKRFPTQVCLCTS